MRHEKMCNMRSRYIVAPLLLACTVFTAACDKPAVHQAVSLDSLPPSKVSQSEDRHVLTGEWEYVDGAVVRLILDEQGNGRYEWKGGRFETQTLVGHTWHGMWSQDENDRDGGFTVEFSLDFSEGEGNWWYSRIGIDRAPTQKGGTFHLSKKDSWTSLSDTPPAP